MRREALKDMVSKETWQRCLSRLKKQETVEVLHKLFDYIVDILADRISQIKTADSRSISFFSEGREFLTINVTRKDLRIYIHPKAKAFFDPKVKFDVERFRFWDGSYHKASGKYRAMSVWISEKKDLPGVKKIIACIPKTKEA
ncbi:MAG: hypothetical protein AMJ91_00030 [candidate division Zixibacteria bacterium SM23_73_3]|nr:MAG: hypothetical protein AMJ91_00030 [candidate division Zixibacteria bacterium SM23_73_3]